MNTRLVKELKPISLPILAALVTGGVLVRLLGTGEIEIGHRLIGNLSTLIFFGSLIIICTQGIGMELQQGTLSLLLTQPSSRKRIWDEKVGVAVLAIGSIVLIEWGISQLFAQKMRFVQWNYFILFIAASVCSGGLWTMMAKSAIGGIVFTVGSECSFLGILYAIFTKIDGPDADLDQHLRAINLAGVFYCLFFFALGRRHFARLQLKGTSSDVGAASQSKPHPGLASWLKPSPLQKHLNLFRKEILLQAPVAKISCAFMIYTLVTIGLLRIIPSRGATIEAFFVTLSVIYGLLIIILASTISLGEEKSLGLHAGQLTLPFSASGQWLIKLVTSVVFAFLLGIAFPLFLAFLVSLLGARDLGISPPDEWDAILAITILIFAVIVVGFWAVSFLENTVRAAFSVIFVVSGLGMCTALGNWLALTTGFHFPFLEAYIIKHQLPPDFFMSPSFIRGGLLLAVVPLISIPLWQSCRQFSRTVSGMKVLCRRGSVLAGATVVLTAAIFCYERTANYEGWEHPPIVSELMRQVDRSGLEFSAPTEPGKELQLTFEQLKQKVFLNAELSEWLRYSDFKISGLPPTSSEKAVVTVEIQFPKGRSYNFSYLTAVKRSEAR